MKILELDLIAFGPFTGRILDFSDGDHGLHIIYGPNEAGKSSSLRALKALLYGVPERTRDNFLHANEKLRIGGRLCLANGSTFSFVRRKGRKNTLFSKDETPLDESCLTPYLQGVGEALFETLFGIDHETLIRGGKEILEQQGDVGQALFAAGLGTADLREVLAELEKEAQNLFLPRGSKPEINQALSKYRDVKKELATASLSAHEWEGHRKNLHAATQTLRKLEDDLRQLDKERNRLRRIRRALPNLAKRRQLRKQLEALGDVVVLAEDFAKRRAEAQLIISNNLELTANAAAKCEGLRQKIGEITVNQKILDQSETIEDLHQRLGSHRKAMTDRPKLEAERSQLLADIGRLCAEQFPDRSHGEIEILRPALSKRRRTRELGSRRETLAGRFNLAEKTIREVEQQLKTKSEALDNLPKAQDAGGLRRAIEAARKAGDLNTMLEEARDHLEQHHHQCHTDLKRLGLWSGTLKDLETLPVPGRETIERFETQFRERLDHARHLHERHEEECNNLQRTIGELEALQLGGTIPDEKTLEQSRAHREQGWTLLCRRWLKDEDVTEETMLFDAGRALPDAYALSVQQADQVADRLRREADRVLKQASLVAHQEEIGRTLTAIEKESVFSEELLQALRKNWSGLWKPCGIDPLPPREMRAWAAQYEPLRTQTERLREHQRSVKRLEKIRNGHCEALMLQFNALDKERNPKKPAQRGSGLGTTTHNVCVIDDTPTYDEILRSCEALLASIDENARLRERLRQEIEGLQQKLETAHDEKTIAAAEKEHWLEQWNKATGAMDLNKDASPSEANDRLDTLEQIFSKFDAAAQLQKRSEGIDQDADVFRTDLQALVEHAAPELKALPADQSVVQINALLARFRQEQTRFEGLKQQIQEMEHEVHTADATVQSMRERLVHLCQEADTKEPVELEAAEQRSDRCKILKKELQQAEQTLLEIGDGAAIDALEDDAQSVDPDALPGLIDALSQRIEKELEPRRNELYKTKGGEEAELRRMDGGAEAADRSERAQEILAGIGAMSERYLRLKLASRILYQAIERYRAENQGPIVRLASAYFSELTCGSFSALRTAFDEHDEPILVGLRTDDNRRIPVAGMSSGTRDQLYLALRLATLEKYVESSEPLPFIVDDILINFDDKRSAETLKALVKIAGRIQVILFTHHSRLLADAQELKSQGDVYVHTL